MLCHSRYTSRVPRVYYIKFCTFICAALFALCCSRCAFGAVSFSLHYSRCAIRAALFAVRYPRCAICAALSALRYLRCAICAALFALRYPRCASCAALFLLQSSATLFKKHLFGLSCWRCVVRAAMFTSVFKCSRCSRRLLFLTILRGVASGMTIALCCSRCAFHPALFALRCSRYAVLAALFSPGFPLGAKGALPPQKGQD